MTLGEHGVLSAAPSRARSLVDMTTSEPALAVEISEAGEGQGRPRGRRAGLRRRRRRQEARLSIMIGGEKDVVDALQPLFETMGKTIVHQGPAGSGQHTKMVNQILIATNMIGVCEALLYGYKAGLDLNTVMQSVASGAAGSWSLSNLGARMIAGNFEPGFFVEHFLKDMGIALAESRRMNLALPGLALAEQLYRAVAGPGLRPQGNPGAAAGAGRPLPRRLAQAAWLSLPSSVTGAGHDAATVEETRGRRPSRLPDPSGGSGPRPFSSFTSWRSIKTDSGSRSTSPPTSSRCNSRWPPWSRRWRLNWRGGEFRSRAIRSGRCSGSTATCASPTTRAPTRPTPVRY